MKKIKTLLLLLAVTGAISAQDISVGNTKFLQPLLEKWVSEYKKVNPASQLEVKNGEVSGLSVVANETADGDVIYFGKYALLPISNTGNPLLGKAKKGLKKTEVNSLIFERDALADDEDFDDEEKAKYTANVYSRKGEVSTTLALAEFFNQTPERIKGKKIIGDDIYVLNAVQKDVNAVAFNTLNYIYNLDSRLLKDNISLLPLNINSKQKEVWATQDIDQIITLLETAKNDIVPVAKFGLLISAEYADDADARNFAAWVLAQGIQYNHEFGFLNLDDSTLTAQLNKVKANYLTFKD
jgi:ABC-type phosphate transport system substrate-binding protein